MVMVMRNGVIPQRGKCACVEDSTGTEVVKLLKVSTGDWQRRLRSPRSGPGLRQQRTEIWQRFRRVLVHITVSPSRRTCTLKTEKTTTWNEDGEKTATWNKKVKKVAFPVDLNLRTRMLCRTACNVRVSRSKHGARCRRDHNIRCTAAPARAITCRTEPPRIRDTFLVGSTVEELARLRKVATVSNRQR